MTAIYRLIETAENEEKVLHESQNIGFILSAYSWLVYSSGRKYLRVTKEKDGIVETIRELSPFDHLLTYPNGMGPEIANRQSKPLTIRQDEVHCNCMERDRNGMGREPFAADLGQRPNFLEVTRAKSLVWSRGDERDGAETFARTMDNPATVYVLDSETPLEDARKLISH